MEGTRWNVDSTTFDTAKKAWRRLCASEKQRVGQTQRRNERRLEPEVETAKRYAREAALLKREADEETAAELSAHARHTRDFRGPTRERARATTRRVHAAL